MTFSTIWCITLYVTWSFDFSIDSIMEIHDSLDLRRDGLETENTQLLNVNKIIWFSHPREYVHHRSMTMYVHARLFDFRCCRLVLFELELKPSDLRWSTFIARGARNAKRRKSNFSISPLHRRCGNRVRARPASKHGERTRGQPNVRCSLKRRSGEQRIANGPISTNSRRNQPNRLTGQLGLCNIW